jgi:hypothetical protein
MYLAAIILLPTGEQKIIEGSNFGFPLFVLKLSKYAKEENKLVKIVSDDFRLLGEISKQLPHVKVEFGTKEMLEMEAK